MRYECVILKKDVCPYEEIDGKTCSKCTIPDIYLGIRPTLKVVTGYEEPEPSAFTYLDKLYYYLINHSDVFKGMGMDQQGELMNELKKVLDKYNVAQYIWDVSQPQTERFSKMLSYQTEIEINDEDVEVEVEYEYEPASGDNWNEPRFCESVSIYNVKDMNGDEVDWEVHHEDYLIKKILNHIHEEGF